MPDPFDPKPCCIVGVCCPPENPDSEEKKVAALASEISRAAGFASREHGPGPMAELAARSVLARYDLVPKGLGAFIVNSYEPYFRDKFKNDLK